MPVRVWGLFILFLSLLLVFPTPILAQESPSASLSLPKTNDFPRIQAFLDLRDAEGDFIHAVGADQVNILEDGSSLPVTRLDELRVGVQAVIAINPGPSFAVRNNKAISRYDLVIEALRNWGRNRLGSSLDDLSLLTTSSASTSHVWNTAELLSILESEQIDARSAIPDLDTLFRAITIASDPTPRPGMGRAVLFITSPPEGNPGQPLDSLISQANQQGVRVHIWYVASSGGLSTQSAQQLARLATETGGSYFPYTGEETLPDPDGLFDPLRYIYSLEYISAVTTSGSHNLAATIQIEDQQIQTNQQSFEVNIQPPQPAFVSPPLVIQRLIKSESRQNSKLLPDDYFPEEYQFQVVFDFPDGRKRSLVSSSLLVDGKVIDENSEEPMDVFTWNLSGYTEDGIHRLQVQVKDVLNMNGSSVELPVEIRIEPQPTDPWQIFRQNTPILVVLLTIVLVAIIFLVLILGGKLLPSTHRAARRHRRKADPLFQYISIQEESSRIKMADLAGRFHLRHPKSSQTAAAFLFDLSDSSDVIKPPIHLESSEVLFGSNPSQATLVLNHPSVEGRHARLIREPDGYYRLFDQGSVAGTWVNYVPITHNGVVLEQGDIIHIGRVGFRFSWREIRPPRKMSVQSDTDVLKPIQKEDE